MKIENGIIKENNTFVGTAKKSFKYGYHPAVKVEIENGTVRWFELDEQDLVNKIISWVQREDHKS